MTHSDQAGVGGQAAPEAPAQQPTEQQPEPQPQPGGDPLVQGDSTEGLHVLYDRHGQRYDTRSPLEAARLRAHGYGDEPPAEYDLVPVPEVPIPRGSVGVPVQPPDEDQGDGGTVAP